MSVKENVNKKRGKKKKKEKKIRMQRKNQVEQLSAPFIRYNLKNAISITNNWR